MSQKIRQVLYAVAGAVAPDILLFYSKRFTMPSLSFSLGMFAAATLLYVLLAAVVALIFPFAFIPPRNGKKEWKSFVVGVSLPVIVGVYATLSRPPLLTNRGDSGTGETIHGTLLDLLAWL
jgi:hypothetical protein